MYKWERRERFQNVRVRTRLLRTEVFQRKGDVIIGKGITKDI